MSQVRAIEVREALGGPWAFNLTGWLILFFPSTVLVIVQESATGYPHFGLVTLSAAVQHLVAGAISLPLATLLRRGGNPLPVWFSVAIWSGIGVARGLVGGAMASVFAGADAGFALRIAAWLVVSWVWMPLFSYTAAQGQHRRALLGALDGAVQRRDAARVLRQRTGEDIREQLITTIQTAVTRTIDDIQSGLAQSQARLDADHFRLLGERLASVSRQVGSVVGQLAEPAATEALLPPKTGAPLISAFTFQRRKPFLSSSLSVAALIAVLVPVCIEIKGMAFLTDVALAMVAAMLTLVLGSRIVPSGLERLYRQIAWVVARYGPAGLIGGLVLAVLRWDDLDLTTTLFILMLPGAISFSAVVVSGAVGLAAANRQVIRSFNRIRLEREADEAEAAIEENIIREQLSQVMHGPVLGRLAACAMALNFHAAEVDASPTERTEQVVMAVAEHLDAAAADLESLTR